MLQSCRDWKVDWKTLPWLSEWIITTTSSKEGFWFWREVATPLDAIHLHWISPYRPASELIELMTRWTSGWEGKKKLLPRWLSLHQMQSWLSVVSKHTPTPEEPRVRLGVQRNMSSDYFGERYGTFKEGFTPSNGDVKYWVSHVTPPRCAWSEPRLSFWSWSQWRAKIKPPHCCYNVVGILISLSGTHRFATPLQVCLHVLALACFWYACHADFPMPPRVN